MYYLGICLVLRESPCIEDTLANVSEMDSKCPRIFHVHTTIPKEVLLKLTQLAESQETDKRVRNQFICRYGVQSGYLVLEDFKTRDLPRPPPAGRESARKLCTAAGAAVFVFMAVLAFGIVVHLLMSMDRDFKISDPPRPTNHTNETVT
ncbi:hypothetical protein HPB52_017033 [Rhipicephalus sanguineus]|uniref:Uncharacterized protein n=1 Tax=Rhipicephalus sanguineus TaxID=34632 RepID=A0A9D4QBI4_RHISA|nr:hypothetical protein HPB52_017033 [Rhipicephalus sanguineus]